MNAYDIWDVKLCEGSILAVTRAYLDGNKTCCYYKIANGNAVLANYLRYDTDRNPRAPWFHSPDLTGQDMTLEPVSEKEAVSMITTYTPLEMDMNPISEYSFE